MSYNQRGITESEGQFSELATSALDTIGYSKKQIIYRAESNSRTIGLVRHIYTGLGFDPLLAGSSGEGVVPHLGSDFDILYILKDVFGVEEGQAEDTQTVFVINKKDVAPGYVTMRLLCIGGGLFVPGIIESCICTEQSGRNWYFSSNRFQTLIKASMPTTSVFKYMDASVTRTGPAMSASLRYDLGIPRGADTCFDSDLVIAVPVYSSILESWAQRTRSYEWPNDSVINEGSQMELLAVSIGSKETIDQDIEWRLCCTRTELLLTSSLNDIQVKLYVLLKMINKSLLNKTSKNITSYMMKNIAYWICEGTRECLFSPGLLIRQFMRALHLLKQCLINNNLPYYMIPERNLLVGKVKCHEKKLLIRKLSSLINEGPTIILSIDKLSRGMVLLYNQPSQAEHYKSTRNYLEYLCLRLVLKQSEWVSQNPDTMFSENVVFNSAIHSILDGEPLAIQLQILNIIAPEWPEHCTDLNYLISLDERLKNYLC